MTLYYFYKICSLDNEYIYIGSTTNFKKRMQKHKSDCYNINSKQYNYKLYTTIRSNGGINNFIFEIIDSIDTDDRQTVLKHEQSLIVEYNSNLNTYKAYINDYDKKQQLKHCKEQYIIKNRDKINAQKRVRHFCVCGREYTQSNRKRHINSSKHKKFEEQQIINNTTNNITINFNITIQQK